MRTKTAAKAAPKARKPRADKGVKRAPRAQAAAPKTATVKATTENLLKTTQLPYDQVVSKVKEIFPTANTSTKSVAWYASRMKKAGVKLPDRQRAGKAA